ncbi:hypothetical protein [Pseudomonas putida]
MAMIDRLRGELNGLVGNMAELLGRLNGATSANKILTEFIVQATDQLDAHVEALHRFPKESEAVREALLQIMRLTTDVTMTLEAGAEQIDTVKATIAQAVADATRAGVEDQIIQRNLNTINSIHDDVESTRALLFTIYKRQEVLAEMYRVKTAVDRLH